MKKAKIFIPIGIVLTLVLALFCVNRYNTNKRNEIALDSIRSAIIGYVFAGEDETKYLDYKYIFTFVDEDTVNVEWRILHDDQADEHIKQDFNYKIKVEDNEFKLVIGKPKNKKHVLYQVAKLSLNEGTFSLIDQSFYDGYNSILGIQMIKESTEGKVLTEYVYLDLKTPDVGSKDIMLPGDVKLD